MREQAPLSKQAPLRKLAKSTAAHRKRGDRKLVIETLEQRELLAGDGLTGQYFHNADLTGLAVERTEAVNFNWGAGAPAAGLDPDTFSVRWMGQIEPLFSETYSFYTTSNQGVRLWVDGKLLIDNWQPHDTQEDVATIALTAGERYDLRMEYYEQFGAAEIRLEWSSGSQSRQVVPAAQLYGSPSGLLGAYSDAFGGAATRIDPGIDFDWGGGRPHPDVAVDRVQVEWTGLIRADYSEPYTFSITSDEGARLWIGEELVIDDWQAHATQTATGEKMLEAGKWYDIRLEYFDATGNAEVQFEWSSASQTGAGTFVPVPETSLLAAKRTSQQFVNPLGAGADPFVTQWDGYYYMVNTTGNNVRMERAEKLEHIHISDSQSNSLVVWEPPGGLSYSEQIWAPELHRINDKWYIYVAASDGSNANHRMHVLERDDPNPLGPFDYKGQLNTGSASEGVGAWAIDGTVLPWQGADYFVWSGWPDPVNPGSPESTQNLYIAQMSDPWTLTGPQVRISRAIWPWERAAGGGGPFINEGPQVLINGDHLHIIYSANGYWMPEYALGRLTYNGTGSLLDASSWQKAAAPAFQQAGDIVGTGHASFTKSPDGAEDWIVYHAHANSNVFQEDRVIHIQPFEYDAAGAPDFGAPLPVSTSLPVPSGSAAPERPFVTADFDASGAVDDEDLSVWAGQFGREVFPGSSADASGDGRVAGADFLAWQRSYVAIVDVDPTVAYWRHEEGPSGGLIPAGANTVLDSSGGANHMQTFDPGFTSATYSSDVSPVPLRSGQPNTASLDFGPGGDGPGRNDDNFTNGKPVNSQQFDALTVELAFKLGSVSGYQNLVGKDGQPTTSAVAPLQIKVRGDDFPNGIDNQLFVEWIDGDGDVHFLASGTSMATSAWMHAAFVLTATSAELYLAGESGGYQLVDAIYGGDFAGTGGEALIASAGNFTVGRGMYNGNVADWADAKIDEVRISAAALSPSEFLFLPSPAATLVSLATRDGSAEALISHDDLTALAASTLMTQKTAIQSPANLDAALEEFGATPAATAATDQPQLPAVATSSIFGPVDYGPRVSTIAPFDAGVLADRLFAGEIHIELL